MDLRFTQEKEMIRDSIRIFAEREVKPLIPKMEEGIFPRSLIKKMGELGFMGMTIPSKYSGGETDFISYILAIHELSKVSATMGVILSVHTSVGTNPILYFGTEEQKSNYVTKLAKGEYLGAFALTEPSSGSDAGSLKTTAERKGTDYILNGSKIFITNGGEADTYVVFASTDKTKGSKGITAFLVEKTTPGFIVGKDEKKMGLHGSRTTQLFFEQMKLPVKSRIGQEGEGFKIAMSNLDVGRIGIAAQSLGIAEAALEYSVAYAKGRHQFGKAIINQQAISFKLAELATKVEAAKLLVYRAAHLRQQGITCGKEAAMAKWYASKVAVEATIEGIQILGGYGYIKDHPMERFFRDAKVCEIYEGTSEIQQIVISKYL